jgi:2-acylglycerol O-acyltransferase 2
MSCPAGERFYGMAADSVFRIPLWRHVYTWLGIVPASAKNLRQHLKWGSVGITPGGIAEMYLAGGAADHIYIKNRKGFVAVGVVEGVDIVSYTAAGWGWWRGVAVAGCMWRVMAWEVPVLRKIYGA